MSSWKWGFLLPIASPDVFANTLTPEAHQSHVSLTAPDSARSHTHHQRWSHTHRQRWLRLHLLLVPSPAPATANADESSPDASPVPTPNATGNGTADASYYAYADSDVMGGQEGPTSYDDGETCELI
mgnify:CR=1 FL=1|jgi:hypothetical protein